MQVKLSKFYHVSLQTPSHLNQQSETVFKFTTIILHKIPPFFMYKHSEVAAPYQPITKPELGPLTLADYNDWIARLAV